MKWLLGLLRGWLRRKPRFPMAPAERPDLGLIAGTELVRAQLVEDMKPNSEVSCIGRRSEITAYNPHPLRAKKGQIVVLARVPYGLPYKAVGHYYEYEISDLLEGQ